VANTGFISARAGKSEIGLLKTKKLENIRDAREVQVFKEPKGPSSWLVQQKTKDLMASHTYQQ
jgi:hypothetical protein